MIGIDKNESCVYPLSFQQERIFGLNVHEALNQNVLVLARLQGIVWIEALEEAINDVVSRHEMLRSVFVDTGGTISRSVTANAQIKLLKNADVDDRNIYDEINKAKEYRFDLTKEIPFRASIFKVFPAPFPQVDAYYLLFVAHCAAMDVGSIEPLCRDVSHAYAARINENIPEWNTVPLQYAEYVSLQRRMMEKADDDNNLIKEDLIFWKKEINELPDNINFWGQSISENSSKRNYITMPIRISPIAHNRMLMLCRRESASLLEIFHAAVLTWLSKCGAWEKIPVGITTSGRYCSEMALSIGAFENTVMVCVAMPERHNFQEIIKNVKESHCAVQKHINLPFDYYEKIIDSKKVSLLRQVKISLRRSSENSLNLPYVMCGISAIAASNEDYDLIFDLDEHTTEEGESIGIDGFIKARKNIFTINSLKEITNRVFSILKNDGTDSANKVYGLPIKESGIADSIKPAVSDLNQRYIPARDVLHNRLIQVWEEMLSVRKIGVRDKFVDLGGDKALHNKMISNLAQIFNKQIVLRHDFENTTIESLSNDMAAQMPVLPIIEVQTNDSEEYLPFFFLHGDIFSGGWYALELSQLLGKDCPFYLIPPCGINGREIAGTIDAMAKDHVEDLLQVKSDGEYCLGGYCNGAAMALGMAHILKEKGCAVSSLILIDAPYVLLNDKDSCADKTDDSQRVHVKQSVTRGDMLENKAMLNNELLKACFNYKTDHYDGKIHLITGVDSLVGTKKVAWEKISNDVEMHLIPGDHEDCVTRNIAYLAEEIKKILRHNCV